MPSEDGNGDRFVLILPAIDLRGGRCVRLRQGDFEQETTFALDPVQTAADWVARGAPALHLVDLDGARDGRPTNEAAIRGIVGAVAVPCHLGGGLRTDADVEAAFSVGVARCILGTRAAQDFAWLTTICRRYPNQICLGLDARDGRVAVRGWTESTSVAAIDLAKRASHLPLAAIVYTDIARDGMMAGPNYPAYDELVRAVAVPIIASGGVAGVDDVRRLMAAGVAGCIVGRALYERKNLLQEMISVAARPSPCGELC
jgi:phosphoribosylformimino-5-aminoimidazole carboxamide ribotide isomerase